MFDKDKEGYNLEKIIAEKKKLFSKQYESEGFLHSYKLTLFTPWEFKSAIYNRYSYLAKIDTTELPVSNDEVDIVKVKCKK